MYFSTKIAEVYLCTNNEYFNNFQFYYFSALSTALKEKLIFIFKEEPNIED